MDKLIDKFEKLRSPEKKIETAIEIISQNRFHTDKSIAIEYREKLIDLIESVNDNRVKGKAYINVSLLTFDLLDMDKSFEYCYKALSCFTLGKDDDQIARVYNNMGVLYSSMDMIDKSVEYLKKSVELTPNEGNPVINLGQKYVFLGKFELGEKYIKRALSIALDENDIGLEISAYLNLCELYYQVDKNDIAKEYAYKARERNKDFNSIRYDGLIELSFGHLYRLEKDIEKAKNHYYRGLKIAEDNDHEELLWFAYNNISLFFEDIEDYKEQNRFLKLMLKFRERMNKRDMENRVSYYQSIFNSQERLMKMRSAMEQNSKLASIGVMAAGIVHEINQPLNSIMVNVSGIKYKERKKNLLPDDYKDSIVQIHSAVDRISSIINHMRSFWANTEEVTNEPTPLNMSVDNALKLIRSQLSSHGITLNRVQDELDDTIVGNKLYIEQIVINLVVNSMQALDKVDQTEKIVTIKSECVEDSILLTIRDNGTGFQADSNIFDPFYSTKKGDKGMGLGLAIVKQFTEEMKGEIKHYNSDGAVIEIRFPISR